MEIMNFSAIKQSLQMNEQEMGSFGPLRTTQEGIGSARLGGVSYLRLSGEPGLK